MQIKKTYYNIKPELLYDELRDLAVKQGVTLGETKFETYSLPTNSSAFISRGTLTFRISGKECLRAHLVGSAVGEIKLVVDINEELFSAEKIKALQEDLDFIFSSYEIKPQ
ncbi:MAG: hypothetical protein JW967_03500 [Dehalococcoidales bacterium]|nr:hypothetical protein [Dehalococcoidales bacterium]